MLDDKLNLILSFLNMVSWKTKSSVILIWLDDKINLIYGYSHDKELKKSHTVYTRTRQYMMYCSFCAYVLTLQNNCKVGSKTNTCTWDVTNESNLTPHVLCVSPTALLDTMCCDVIYHAGTSISPVNHNGYTEADEPVTLCDAAHIAGIHPQNLNLLFWGHFLSLYLIWFYSMAIAMIKNWKNHILYIHVRDNIWCIATFCYHFLHQL